MQPLGSPTEQPSVFTRSPRITLIGNAGYPSRGLGQPPIPEFRTDDWPLGGRDRLQDHEQEAFRRDGISQPLGHVAAPVDVENGSGAVFIGSAERQGRHGGACKLQLPLYAVSTHGVGEALWKWVPAVPTPRVISHGRSIGRHVSDSAFTRAASA